MSGIRLRRIQEAYKQEISKLIQREMKDPRIGFVSVTDVEISGDMSLAKVFVSVLGDTIAKKKTMTALHSANAFIRVELGKRIRLRHTPELKFYLDESIERGVKLKGLLDRLEVEESEGVDEESE